MYAKSSRKTMGGRQHVSALSMALNYLGRVDDIYRSGTTCLDRKLPDSMEFRIPPEALERLVAKSDPDCLASELLRTLASRLIRAQESHPLKKVLITSSVRGEGKTLISTNLAITLALLNKRVLLVDADLRSANLSRWLNVANNAFIAACDEGPHNRPALFRKEEDLPLWVLPAGRRVGAPVKILQSSGILGAFAAFERDFDWIIIDSPPLVHFSDASILSGIADAVALVTRRAVTPMTMLEDALKTIDKTKIIATIFNGADIKSQRYFYDY
jgi:tyrosine-protein kinase Etk/Wzc